MGRSKSEYAEKEPCPKCGGPVYMIRDNWVEHIVCYSTVSYICDKCGYCLGSYDDSMP